MSGRWRNQPADTITQCGAQHRYGGVHHDANDEPPQGSHSSWRTTKIAISTPTLPPIVSRSAIPKGPWAANSALSDAQLAAVLNWLAQTFDSDALAKDNAPLFTTAEVTGERYSPLPSVLATRRAIVKDLAATGLAPPASY